MRHLVYGLALLMLLLSAAPGGAYDSLVEKKTFAMPSYTTVGGQAIKNVLEYFEIEGDGGHLDGVLAVTKAGEVIRKFLNQ
jgi:homoserine O-acetyltransferase/O-succinyltransferase